MSDSDYDYQVVTYGQAFVVRGTFFDAFGSGFSPSTVNLWVTEPTGTQYFYTKTQQGTVVKEWDSSGSIYYALFAANHVGYWRWKFEGTADGQPVGQDQKPNHGAFAGRVFVRYGDGTV